MTTKKLFLLLLIALYSTAGHTSSLIEDNCPEQADAVIIISNDPEPIWPPELANERLDVFAVASNRMELDIDKYKPKYNENKGVYVKTTRVIVGNNNVTAVLHKRNKKGEINSNYPAITVELAKVLFKNGNVACLRLNDNIAVEELTQKIKNCGEEKIGPICLSPTTTYQSELRLYDRRDPSYSVLSQYIDSTQE